MIPEKLSVLPNCGCFFCALHCFCNQGRLLAFGRNSLVFQFQSHGVRTLYWTDLGECSLRRLLCCDGFHVTQFCDGCPPFVKKMQENAIINPTRSTWRFVVGLLSAARLGRKASAPSPPSERAPSRLDSGAEELRVALASHSECIRASCQEDGKHFVCVCGPLWRSMVTFQDFYGRGQHAHLQIPAEMLPGSRIPVLFHPVSLFVGQCLEAQRESNKVDTKQRTRETEHRKTTTKGQASRRRDEAPRRSCMT